MIYLFQANKFIFFPTSKSNSAILRPREYNTVNIVLFLINQIEDILYVKLGSHLKEYKNKLFSFMRLTLFYKIISFNHICSLYTL